MTRYALGIIALMFALSACTAKTTTQAQVAPEPVSRLADGSRSNLITTELRPGECVHLGDGVFRVTVVGKDSYGFEKLNDSNGFTEVEGRSVPLKNNFHTLPKIDTHEKGVRTDCYDDMFKAHLAYLKLHGGCQ